MSLESSFSSKRESEKRLYFQDDFNEFQEPIILGTKKDLDEDDGVNLNNHIIYELSISTSEDENDKCTKKIK